MDADVGSCGVEVSWGWGIWYEWESVSCGCEEAQLGRGSAVKERDWKASKGDAFISR